MNNNYYSQPKGYLTDPFTPLYQENFIAQNFSIKKIWNFASNLETKISGDFNLPSLINQIDSQFLSYIKVGLIAFKVKNWRLWEQNKSLSSFKDFCAKCLNKQSWQIDSYIKAARVCMELIAAGFSQLPQSLAQASVLARYFQNDLIEAWQKCLDNIPFQKMSRQRIEENLGLDTNHKKGLKLPKSLYERLLKKASREGKSVEEILEDFLGEDDKTDVVPPSKTEEWEHDLEQLIEEQSFSTQQLYETHGHLRPPILLRRK